jgi:hypothetical protein
MAVNVLIESPLFSVYEPWTVYYVLLEHPGRKPLFADLLSAGYPRFPVMPNAKVDTDIENSDNPLETIVKQEAA